MDQWQIDALVALLSGDFLESSGKFVHIDEDSFYTHSEYTGSSRRHIISREAFAGELIISQVEPAERYQQKVVLRDDEIEPLLKVLLMWHLSKVEARNDEQQPKDNSFLGNGDGLGGLDDHPF